MRSFASLLLSLTLVVAGCATAPVADAWHTRLAHWLDEDMDALLLGEQHDAPEHQQWQRDTIRWLNGQQRLAAVVLEMAESGSNTADLPPTASEAQVRAALHWNESAWPWQSYGPVIMEAVAAHIPVYGGNLPRQYMHAAMQDAQWDTRLPAAAWQQQRQAIAEGHCHMLPQTQITPMTRIQLARDASMARAVLTALVARQLQQGVVLLIAGSRHVQRETGVPAWLPPEMALKIAIAQADNTAHALPADHIHATSAVMVRDYCAQFKEHLRTPQ